jgi:GT2 family glycosyltransferase
MTSPAVDVVIATYNRQQRLASTLRSLQRQTASGFGVLVVDDGSDPPVQSALAAELRDQPGVRVLRSPGNRGPAGARNLAISQSTADVIAFIDDDVDADEGWLEAHLHRLAAGPGNAVVIGPLLAPRDWRPTPWNRWEAAKVAVEYRRMQAGEYAPTWRQFFTGNALVRREHIIAAGGFNESLRRAEDIELGVRLSQLGCSFVFEPAARGWHYANRSREAWLSNADSYAAVDLLLDSVYPELGWHQLMEEELSSRSRASRLAGSVGVAVLGRDGAVSAAVGLATLCNRGPLTFLSVKAASLAYDIRYRSSLASLTRESRLGTAAPEQPGG